MRRGGQEKGLRDASRLGSTGPRNTELFGQGIELGCPAHTHHVSGPPDYREYLKPELGIEACEAFIASAPIRSKFFRISLDSVGDFADASIRVFLH